MACVLGRSGKKALKREGDGATPIGSWRLGEAFRRADRVIRPRTGLSLRSATPSDGWCDAASDRNYNRSVRHPYPTSAERLWRADGLYDLMIVLDYNRRPRIKGRGSAIFLHIAREEGGRLLPTEGCIALKRRDLIRLLPHLQSSAVLRIL